MAKTYSILFVTAEVYPFLKTSELADVLYAHSLGSREVGHDLRVMMPKYGFISERRNRIHDINRLRDIPIPVGNDEYPATVKSSSINNPRVKVQAYITTNTNFLDAKKGMLAELATGKKFTNNDDRYIFYNRTVLETCMLLGWFPDIIHCVGWQTALIPAYIKTMFADEFKKTKVIMTIDDFNEQGSFTTRTAAKTLLPDNVQASMDYKGRANFLRSGMEYADMVTTLSPRYAEQLSNDKEFKANWAHLLKGKPLHGVPHGLDLMVWNSKTDTQIKHKFEASDLSGKTQNRELLQKQVGLTVNGATRVAAVLGPLSDERGTDKLLKNIPLLLQHDVQVVVATDMPSAYKTEFDALALANPGKIVSLMNIDEELLHLIIASSTFILKPSKHEVSGQYQRAGLVYGTIPVVRNVAGIAEGLVDATANPAQGNAFVYEADTAAGLADALKRALEASAVHATWDAIVQNAMSTYVGWQLSSKPYDELYRNLMKE